MGRATAIPYVNIFHRSRSCWSLQIMGLATAIPYVHKFCRSLDVHVMVSQNVGHHLVGAGRLDDLKQLLASPGWLERKLHSYGTASAVADFRR